MNELFLRIVNMSIASSWLVLAVLILRFVLGKAPQVDTYAFVGHRGDTAGLSRSPGKPVQFDPKRQYISGKAPDRSEFSYTDRHSCYGRQDQRISGRSLL